MIALYTYVLETATRTLIEQLLPLNCFTGIIIKRHTLFVQTGALFKTLIVNKQ